MDKLLDWETPATAEDKVRTDRVEKKYIIEQMARQCGVGERLVDYWMRMDAKVPEATAFFSACRAVFDEGIPSGFLYSAREQWDTRDWRGKKGQLPQPAQLLEQALRML